MKHLSEETGALHWQYADLCIGSFNEPDVLKHEEVAEGVCSLLIVLGRTALDILSDVLDWKVRHVFRLFESCSDYLSDMNLGFVTFIFPIRLKLWIYGLEKATKFPLLKKKLLFRKITSFGKRSNLLLFLRSSGIPELRFFCFLGRWAIVY